MAVPAFVRRWFRFSLLQFLIVVTLFGGWLGYHLSWIRQRRDAPVYEMKYVSSIMTPSGFKPTARTSDAPWPLRWFGEQGRYGLIILANAGDDEIERNIRLFPEAKINLGLYVSPGDGEVERISKRFSEAELMVNVVTSSGDEEVARLRRRFPEAGIDPVAPEDVPEEFWR